MSTRVKLVSGTVVLTLAIAGGVAYAAIGDGGVIQGCYDAGGNLKVIPAPPCPKGYTSLQWNQQGSQGAQGPQGPQGAQGPQGEQGPQGPAGSGAAYSATSDGVALPAGETTVISKTLPAGKYVLNASVVLENSASGGRGGSCWIPGYATGEIIFPAGQQESLSLTSAVDHAGGAIELTCFDKGTADLRVAGASLTAIEVDSIG